MQQDLKANSQGQISPSKIDNHLTQNFPNCKVQEAAKRQGKYWATYLRDGR